MSTTFSTEVQCCPDKGTLTTPLRQHLGLFGGWGYHREPSRIVSPAAEDIISQWGAPDDRIVLVMLGALALFIYVGAAGECFAFFFSRFIVNRYENKYKLVRVVGHQEFEIPKNVLDLVYTQTLCWYEFGFFCNSVSL